MLYLGEIISLGVAVSWTITALCAEVASKRLGSTPFNVLRMLLSLIMLGTMLLVVTGSAVPRYADAQTWLWLLASGFVGYLFGDYCLFNCYVIIGSRFGQLFMTLAPIASALFGYLLMGETIRPLAMLGMAVIIGGISLAVFSKKDASQVQTASADAGKVHLPLKGILLGIGAGTGQGIGLVLSKVGMLHYEQCIPATDTDFATYMPFASTFIRAVMGLTGFVIVLALQGKLHLLKRVFHERVAMANAVSATVFGPFIGVSFSLMAVLYTSTGVAQTLMALTPVFILWPAHLLFHQKVTLKEVLGAVIAVGGVILFFV